MQADYVAEQVPLGTVHSHNLDLADKTHTTTSSPAYTYKAKLQIHHVQMDNKYNTKDTNTT